MADLLSYGEEDISRLFPKCRLPTSASCGDVSASQRDLIDFSDASAASPRRPTTAAGTANSDANPGGAACRDRDRAGVRRTWMATSASMDQIRRVGSCEPPGDDSDSSSGRVPAPRDSRIELAGGRELYSQSRSRPGKRRPPAGSRGRPPPETAAKPAPRPAETPDSLHLAILGFQPLRETSLIGEGPGGGGDAFGVGDTPVVDGPVAFDCATARVPPPVVENGRVVVEDANNGKVSRGGETTPVTVTFDTAALVGETGDQASRANRRVIGSLPIAEYEGSPRRYGPKPPKPGPGLPQRVWHQSAADPVCQPPREYSGDREKGNGGWVDSGAEEGVNVAPVAMAEPRGHYFRPSDVRGLASEATPDAFDHPGTVSAAPGSYDMPPAEASAVVDVISRTSSSAMVTVEVPPPPEPSAASPPPDLAVGCEAAATAAGAGCDAGADADASRNFTLSPETTECDSGEVESELSDGGSLPSSGGRLCAATMPVLEDGLSDGAASDDERPPPPPPDPTAELIRHHLSQLESASAHCRPPGELQPAVPVSQSLLPSSEQLYVPPSLYQPPTQSLMLSQSLLQRPGPPVLSAGPQSYPTGLACARQREMGDYLSQQQQGQPPGSSRYGNGDIDLRTLDPLGTVRSSPPPPAPGSGAGSPAPSTGRQAARRSAPPVSPGHQPPEDVQAAIQDIRQTLRRTRALPVRSPPSPSDLERPDRPVWIPRRSGYQKLSTQCDDPASGPRPENEEGVDTDQETDRLLGQQRSPAGPAADDGRTTLDKSWCQSRPRIPKSLTTGDLTPCSPSGPDGRLKERDAIKKKGRSKEVMVHEPAVLIEGVLFRARYLGSTQLVCEGQPTKATRMMQAEEAVSRIKAADAAETRSLPACWSAPLPAEAARQLSLPRLPEPAFAPQLEPAEPSPARSDPYPSQQSGSVGGSNTSRVVSVPGGFPAEASRTCVQSEYPPAELQTPDPANSGLYISGSPLYENRLEVDGSYTSESGVYQNTGGFAGAEQLYHCEGTAYEDASCHALSHEEMNFSRNRTGGPSQIDELFNTELSRQLRRSDDFEKSCYLPEAGENSPNRSSSFDGQVPGIGRQESPEEQVDKTGRKSQTYEIGAHSLYQKVGPREKFGSLHQEARMPGQTPDQHGEPPYEAGSESVSAGGGSSPSAGLEQEAGCMYQERRVAAGEAGPDRREREARSAPVGSVFRLRYMGAVEVDARPENRRRRAKHDMVLEAITRMRVPDGETQPSTDVDLFISTEKIMVLNTDLKEIMMDHALRTISYIADIGELVVLMARRRVTSEIAADLHTLPKMICHVFESDEAQFIAQSIGQAFQVAYMEFLKANGIEDHSFVKEMDYQEVLNSQEIFGEELKMFAKKELQKEVVVPKQKGEILGVVIVESGWGSLVPTVVIANLAPSGAAARCGLLNIGDQIIAINGISLVGLPLAACQAYVKNAKPATVVKLTVVPCPPVVEVKIRRPDTKYQLGFSVQNGVICSLLRGGIAERGGVRVGHRIIEINSQSVVAVPHDRIVSLLATSVGEIHMKTMPTSLFRLLTGQESPVYI